MLNVKKISEYFLESSDKEIRSFGRVLEEERNQAFLKHLNTDSDDDYWKKHKLVVYIKSDRDFWIKRQEDQKLSSVEYFEWCGESKQECIELAEAYFLDIDNYKCEDRRFNFVLETLINPTFAKIKGGLESFGFLGANWEFEINYDEPDKEEPKHVDFRPTSELLSKINLFSEEELAALGFIESKGHDQDTTI
ncbi:hypothetical protein [Photobacterium kishitanii]|uniref:Uncharacterized protein n=1 Tax=Photobacterium kishitanii TaxID=318456 RepID=A0A2T3KL19_9GAMM|nr:hypothetical protein [Photobacterium kishitanii]PSV00415.1 hypothetical protein C9J27_04605 [Photobacterium kishitanii]